MEADEVTNLNIHIMMCHYLGCRLWNILASLHVLSKPRENHCPIMLRFSKQPRPHLSQLVSLVAIQHPVISSPQVHQLKPPSWLHPSCSYLSSFQRQLDIGVIID